MAIWDDMITQSERGLIEGMDLTDFGNKPALIIVDMSYGFADPSFPLGCETGFDCARNIKELLKLARTKEIPTFFTTFAQSGNPLERGLWKRSEKGSSALTNPKEFEIIADLQPLGTEPVIKKTGPSAFFGTTLINMLVRKNIDTLIITGLVTSACVFATAVDAFSYGYKVFIPEECTSDKTDLLHKIALFNFHLKYGDVVKTCTVKNYFSHGAL